MIKNISNIENYENPFLLHPEEYKTQTDLFEAIKHWWIFRYRKKESTIKDRLRYAQKMSEHQIFPVNWLEFNPIKIIKYLEHREYIDYNNTRGKHQIINEWKTVKTFAKAFGVNADLWGYIPPTPPKAKVKIIPLPPEVYSILHHRYSTNNYENALVTHILTHSFHIGWRPSELVIQNVNDVYLNEGYLIISETKKYSQPRQIWPDKTIMTSRQKKSFKNYMQCWRPQVANEHSRNALFLQPNGKRVTPQYLREKLSPAGKKIAGQFFHLYTMRHTYATYLYNYTKDINLVSKALGHTKLTNTTKYIHVAEWMQQQVGGNLFNHALKPHNVIKSVCGRIAKNRLSQKKGSN